MKLVHVAGARPNFMKIAPLMRAFEPRGVEQHLVHTGQHYDEALSRVFFDELGIPKPEVNLGIGSASHAVQTARIMMAFETLATEMRPDLVVVVGDVNSTLAAALVCAKLGIPVAHVEAGLRSLDWGMPEEINRVITDRLSELLFTTERSAEGNLLKEGIAPERIHFVGNVMIDTLLAHLEHARRNDVPAAFGLQERDYAVVTLHRPSNVDDADRLGDILAALSQISQSAPVLFPIHPRTLKRVHSFGLQDRLEGVQVIEPLGYLDFLGLMASAGVVLTDSGGIQEESTVLGVDCLTLRENTERPVTLEQGTNRLVPLRTQAIVETALAALNNEVRERKRPELWDGGAADRIADTVLGWWENRSSGNPG